MSEVCLRKIQSHFIGGTQRRVCDLPIQHREVVRNGGERPLDMNGSYAVGQMYAMEYRLAQPRSPYPVLLWHGGGMTGAQWESTPDGRQGWLWRLLEAGYDVVVCDAVERGRAGWAMFPQIYAEAPVFRSAEEAWRLFRIGPAWDAAAGRGEPFAGQRFPHGSFETLVKQMVPRWLGHEAMASAAYDALLEQFGACIVIGHSQGGGYAAHAACRKPHLVRAVVGVEPTGMPASRGWPHEGGQGAHMAAHLVPQQAPHLAVWGDHFAHSPQWQKYRAQTDAYWRLLGEAGVPAQVLDLPGEGMAGNSHFCMLDTNSDEVLQRILDWLRVSIQ